MEPYQQRVIDEQKNIEDKIIALAKYIPSARAVDYGEPAQDFDLLSIQLQAMRTYDRCLTARINRWKNQQEG